MKGKFSIRGLVALTLAVALFFHALPSPARGAELVSGWYLLRCGEVYLGTWDDGWITAVSEEYAEPWTLTVAEDAVTLTDPNGVTVCPGPEGLSKGEGSWQVTFEEGLFRFRSVYEGVLVILAANAYADFGFRAVPEAEVAAAPEIYPSGFMLYPVPEDAPEETTVPEETTAPEETAPPTTPPEETLPQPPELPWQVCFGRLHSHSAVSDGSVSAAELFARARDEGLDFYAVTDHSDSFDNDTQGNLGADGGAISVAWAAGRAAASVGAAGRTGSATSAERREGRGRSRERPKGATSRRLITAGRLIGGDAVTAVERQHGRQRATIGAQGRPRPRALIDCAGFRSRD